MFFYFPRKFVNLKKLREKLNHYLKILIWIIKNEINKLKSKFSNFHFNQFNLFVFSLYRKYGVIGQKKAEVKYVVSKRSQRGGRPSGVKGPYKVVDKRLKKDKRATKSQSKRQSSGKGGGRKQQGKGKGGGRKQQSNGKGGGHKQSAKVNNRKK